jgi:hypothetical protein
MFSTNLSRLDEDRQFPPLMPFMKMIEKSQEIVRRRV